MKAEQPALPQYKLRYQDVLAADTDIYDQITQDHRNIETMLEDLAKTPSASLLKDLRKEILSHFGAEEGTVYRVGNRLYEYQDDTSDMEDEHENIREKLRELCALPLGEKPFAKALSELEELCKDHFNNEESIYLEPLFQTLGESLLESLAERYQEKRSENLS